MIRQIVEAVSEALSRAGLIQAEVSARHAHLSQADIETLFGPGASLTPERELSQPGQYLSEQRVTIIGARGSKDGFAVLGPARSSSQVELSRSDCVALGINAPVRQSGDVAGSGSCVLEGPHGRVTLTEGCIIAQNHLHMKPDTAQKLKLGDGQFVSVKILTNRPIIFPGVLVRVSEKFNDRIHLDFDEANAACVQRFTLGQIVSEQCEKGYSE